MQLRTRARRAIAIAGVVGITAFMGLSGASAAFASSPTTITYTTAATTTTSSSGTTTTAGNAVGTAFSWTVPTGVTKVTISAAGGNGGSVTNPLNGGFGVGGTGAVATATLAVTPGEILTMSLGGDGPTGGSSLVDQTGAPGGPGGGAGGSTSNTGGTTSINGGGGGSSTMIAANDPTMTAAGVVMVAGAGGGGPSSGTAVGGNGGTPVGGSSGSGAAGTGEGGNVEGPGLGGLGGDFVQPVFDQSNTVTDGTDGVGGSGGNTAANTYEGSYTGGGGGGGYGGGGGGAFIMFDLAGGLGYGGGGGGSFVVASATKVSYALRTDAIANGSISLAFGTTPVLASTGVDPLPLVGLSALLLLAGAAIVLAPSRRRIRSQLS